MNSVRCNKCGMANFAAEIHCRRCSAQLFSVLPRKKEKRPRRFSIISLAIYAALIYGGYFLYQDARRSIEEVNNNEAFRVGEQVPQKPQQASLSRNEQDRQRASYYRNSIKDSPALEAKRKQEEQTQRAAQHASGSQ